jgi:hypothetical protein
MAHVAHAYHSSEADWIGTVFKQCERLQNSRPGHFGAGQELATHRRNVPAVSARTAFTPCRQETTPGFRHS